MVTSVEALRDFGPQTGGLQDHVVRFWLRKIDLIRSTKIQRKSPSFSPKQLGMNSNSITTRGPDGHPLI